MDTGFVDLDILLTKIRNPQSKAYFLDAVKAYKAGALRASMTSVWVALVYDLIAKYRELSALGDAAANAFIQSWDNATSSNDIKQLLQLEARIIEDATINTQIVNRLHRSHLDRLREDRNLCAHPAFSAEAELFEPSHELVRLHLVNTVDLVLSQEALQGKAILELFDADVQSAGFPTAHAHILNYVEHRYLTRVRTQNINNFGTVLAKSLLQGTPSQWESAKRKIISSLVAVRERAASPWQNVALNIVRLLDNLAPENRPRAITFIAEFPDFWPLIQSTTQTALRETAANSAPATLIKYQMLASIGLPQFRDALLSVIPGLTPPQLRDAITAQPIAELWPSALDIYRNSSSYRGSESNFREFITPFIGKLTTQQHDQLLDAISENGQNWDASATDSALLNVLHNATRSALPAQEARNRFYSQMRRMSRLKKYQDVFTLLQADGWTPPPPQQEDD